MRSATSLKLGFLGLGVCLVMALPAWAQTVSKDAIGFFAAVAGQVQTTHVGRPAAIPAKLREAVFFKDLIETQATSRAKAMFQDDSILTVGENSRVEISEHVYDPANNQRSTVLKLTQGKARALVGKLFAAAGSKFEIHTPTAVVAARGTYFVVWIEEGTKTGDAGTIRPVLFGGQDLAQDVGLPPGTTGVANISNRGVTGANIVSFTSGGKAVDIEPGMYAFALPGEPPLPPVQITLKAPAGVLGAIKGTELSDARKTEMQDVRKAGLPGQTPELPPLPITPPGCISGSCSQAATGAPADQQFPSFTGFTGF